MGRDDIYPVRMSKVGFLLHYSAVTTDFGHPYLVYRVSREECARLRENVP